MDGPRRTGSTLTGRPPRDAVRPRLADAGAQPATREVSPELETDIAASLETIGKVTETYGVLLDKLSAYELKVRDLTRKLGEESRTAGDALRAAARAEETAREAQSRAALAEAEAARSADTVRELEHQLGALRAQTAKLMDAVEQLFPDFDDAELAPPRGLRVVR